MLRGEGSGLLTKHNKTTIVEKIKRVEEIDCSLRDEYEE
jgi:hypothetical protein